MLTISSCVDVMNRLGRAMADPTRSRILLTLLERTAYPAELARDLELTRSNVSNHLACLRDCGIAVAVPGELGAVGPEVAAAGFVAMVVEDRSRIFA